MAGHLLILVLPSFGRPDKCPLKFIFVTLCGYPDEVSDCLYTDGIFLRYKDDIFLRQNSLHMCPICIIYIKYGKL